VKRIKVTVDAGKLPETGDDWELYTASMKCERVARSLTAALKRAIEAVEAGKTSSEAMREHFDPVARKYADYGACDTEPTGLAGSILDRVMDLTKHSYRR